MTTIDWTTLDKLNVEAGHYGRGKPERLLALESELKEAQQDVDAVIESRPFTRESEYNAALAQASAKVIAIEKEKTLAYNNWQMELAGDHKGALIAFEAGVLITG